MQSLINFHVINLAERKDRWESLLERFRDDIYDEKTNPDGWCEFIRIDAIYNLDQPYMGASMSHLKAIEMHSENIHIVIEDDIAKTTYWSKEEIITMIEFLSSNLDKWDVFTDGNIYLQGCIDFPFHPFIVKPVKFASIQFCIYNMTSEKVQLIRSLYETSVRNYRGSKVGPKCFDTFLATSDLNVIAHTYFWSYQVSGYSTIADAYMDYMDDYYKGNSYLLAQRFFLKNKRTYLHKYLVKYRITKEFVIEQFREQMRTSFNLPERIYLKDNCYINISTNRFQ